MADRSTPRLESLDALRGLDAALIIGLGTALWHVHTACSSDFWNEVRYHMGHVEWEGLRVYDLIFPLFVLRWRTWNQCLHHLCPRYASDCAISLVWCGKALSIPPQ